MSCTSTLVTLLLLVHVELSSGHAILVNPRARCGQGELTNPAIKLRPFVDATTTANQGCGGAGNYAGNYPDGPQDVVAIYEPGQPLDVQWLMTIPHEADRLNTGVRIALHYANGDSFADNILIDGGDAGTGRGSTITTTVQIPRDKTCENCVLQWMWAAEQDGGFYMACADIAIREGGGIAPLPPVCARQAAPGISGDDDDEMSHGPAHLVGDIFPGSDSHPTQMHPCGALLCFQATDAAHGAELWSSTGLEGGSQMVRDIAPGPAGSRPAEFMEWKGKLYFAADDGVHGKELWETDGTLAGTSLVKDINPGEDGSYCMKTAIGFGDVLLFVADDGEHGNELWRTDGTYAGTSLVLDIWPVSAAQAAANPNDGLGNPNSFLVAFDKLWFSANDGTGYELWSSDGTTAGTRLVMDINTNPPSPQMPLGSSPHGLLAVGDVIVFVADDGVHGMELWTHNPQTSTTSLLLDIQPNTAWGVPGTLVNGPGGMAYFSGDDGVHGVELWRTDGTAAGTTMVADLHPGEASSTVLRAQTSAILDGRLFYAEGQGPNVQLMATCVDILCLPSQIGHVHEDVKSVVAWQGQLWLLTLSRILVSPGQDNSGFDLKAPCNGDTLTIGLATTTLVPVVASSHFHILFFAAKDSRHGVELHALLASKMQDRCPPLPSTDRTFNWGTRGEWGVCSTSCGTGSQSRSVQCMSSTGETAAEFQCLGSKPPTSQECTVHHGCDGQITGTGSGWFEFGRDTRCEHTGNYEHAIEDITACQAEAIDASSMYFSFNSNRRLCYHSTHCLQSMASSDWSTFSAIEPASSLNIHCIRMGQDASSRSSPWMVLAGQGNQHCCEDQTDYRGTVSTPQGPGNCLNWLTNPIRPYQRDEALGIGDHNLCRNPGTENIHNGACAFCYTDDPQLPVQCCEIGEIGSGSSSKWGIQEGCQLDECALNTCDKTHGKCDANRGGYTCGCVEPAQCIDMDCTICQVPANHDDCITPNELSIRGYAIQEIDLSRATFNVIFRCYKGYNGLEGPEAAVVCDKAGEAYGGLAGCFETHAPSDSSGPELESAGASTGAPFGSLFGEWVIVLIIFSLISLFMFAAFSYAGLTMNAKIEETTLRGSVRVTHTARAAGQAVMAANAMAKANPWTEEPVTENPAEASSTPEVEDEAAATTVVKAEEEAGVVRAKEEEEAATPDNLA